MVSSTSFHPEVLWAQRANEVFLTVNVPDIENETHEFVDNKLIFLGKAADGKSYQFELEFYKTVESEGVKCQVSPRNIFFVIPKKEKEEPFWPRLYAGSVKQAYVKTDFSRWKDEDDEEDEMGAPDFSQFGGGGDLGNMDFSKYENNEENDSDDEVHEEEEKPETEEISS